MDVHYGLENLHIHNPVVTLGSFDGLHKGHVKVLQALRDEAKRVNGETVIVSFEPHPRAVLYPHEPAPGILTTVEEKIGLLKECGVDHLVLLPFTLELAQLDYKEFVKRILVDGIGVRVLVVGYDHRFGRNREGSFDTLKSLSEVMGFELMQEQVYEEKHINVSSTKIRNALAVGDINTVNNYLGYNYSFSGCVVMGQQLGRKMGFPTANIQLHSMNKLLPATGVYAVEVIVDSVVYGGMLNIGTRPTVSRTGETSVEVHIFNFNKDIYGNSITVRFVERVRGERRFENVDELKQQLCVDKQMVECLLAECH
ncbi:MAG: bifunctional riboflavin kinase/FAD synthetase [Marinifilaceae bacterium]